MLEPLTPRLDKKQSLAVVARSVSLNLVAGALYYAYVHLVLWLALCMVGLFLQGHPGPMVVYIAYFLAFILALAGVYFFGVSLAALGQTKPSLLGREKTKLFVNTSMVMWLVMICVFSHSSVALLCFTCMYGAYVAGLKKTVRRIDLALSNELLPGAAEHSIEITETNGPSE